MAQNIAYIPVIKLNGQNIYTTANSISFTSGKPITENRVMKNGSSIQTVPVQNFEDARSRLSFSIPQTANTDNSLQNPVYLMEYLNQRTGTIQIMIYPENGEGTIILENMSLADKISMTFEGTSDVQFTLQGSPEIVIF